MTDQFPTGTQTEAAPVDALLIARAFVSDDDDAVQLLLKHCDPWSCTLQLAGWLRTAIDVALKHGAGERIGCHNVDDMLAFWLNIVQNPSSTEQHEGEAK